MRDYYKLLAWFPNGIARSAIGQVDPHCTTARASYLHELIERKT